MCGIAGIFNLNGEKVDPKILHRMDYAIRHRGPDGHGEYIERNVGLANRRLAIIDPTPAGRQPMSTADQKLWITFNGEIFNYMEIKNELIKKGYSFRSNTDTEVVLYAFREFGEDCLNKFIGQFAFAIWDSKNSFLFLARDHVGINPLFYIILGKTFLFASEVKGILASGLVKRRLNFKALHHYLSVFHITTPLTIFDGVKNLEPGCFLKVNKDGVKMKKYYEVPIGNYINRRYSFEEGKKFLKELLVSSVNYAKVADVPVGAFLSGGIDSSTVVALLSQMTQKKVNTFSMWAEGGEAFDERNYAKLIARQCRTDHTEVTVTPDELIREFPKMVYYFDQPTGGSLESYFLSKIASRKVKVVLSGLGADEIFSGYHSNIYRTEFLARIYNLIPKSVSDMFCRLINKLSSSEDVKKTVNLANQMLRLPTSIKRRLFLYFAYQELEKKHLYSKEFRHLAKKYNTDSYFDKYFEKVKGLPTQCQFTFVDLKTYTRDELLSSINMMTMAHSLEARIPFLDRRLIEYSSFIPPEYKYRRGVSKYIFKEIVKEWLPPEIIKHKKIGFALPRTVYMQGNLKPYILKLLSKEAVKKRGLFNPNYIDIVVKQFYKSHPRKMLWREHLRVWILFIFELWCRLYIDNQRVEIPSVSLSDIADL